MPQHWPWLLTAGLASILAVAGLLGGIRLMRSRRWTLAAISIVLPFGIALGAWQLAGLTTVKLQPVDRFAISLDQAIGQFTADRGRTPRFQTNDWKDGFRGPLKKSGKPYPGIDIDAATDASSETGLQVTADPQLQFTSMVVYRRHSAQRYSLYSVSYASKCTSKACRRMRHRWRVCAWGDSLQWWRPTRCGEAIQRTTSGNFTKAEREIDGMRADRLV